MKLVSSFRMCLIAGMFVVSNPVFAADAPAQSAAAVNEDAGVPVYPYDITDRPYEVLGEVHANVRKATVFSKAPDQAKIYRVLWKDALKMHADAVIKVHYGDPHVTFVSWGSVAASGTAIRFTGPAQPAKAGN